MIFLCFETESEVFVQSNLKSKKKKPPDLAAHSTANFRCKKSPQIDFKIMKSETQAAQIAC